MTIRYTNGEMFEAVLLSRTDTTLRVARRASDDVIELTRIRDAWVTDDCEPVQVAFEWQKVKYTEIPTLEDCLCSPELAARLIHLLYSEEIEEPVNAPLVQSAHSAAALLIV